MAFSSVSDFLNALHRFGLLESEWEEVTRQLEARYHDPRTLARELLNRNWLTAYQINQLFSGHGEGLVLGPYRVLERLGEGGMGKVFKGWHHKLDRLVALKVLHKEYVDRKHAVERFFQEIQVAARLSHPNIVFAFDADRIQDTYFLAMEYVDGIALGRLVQEVGPLPIAQACDFVRQAALGLQHAHERGLVHRDIKPSNLLMTRAAPTPQPIFLNGGSDGAGTLEGTRPAQIKVIDFGLARLRPSGHHVPPRRITRFGTVMGTPDFIAPEQIADTHAADVRSDLYSLGCTFYFLLAGKLPFPGGSAIDKFRRHETRLPTPLQALRPEVPVALVGIVQRLMAKKPADRFQLPVDLAAELAAFLHSGMVPATKPRLSAPRLAPNGEGLSSTSMYQLS